MCPGDRDDERRGHGGKTGTNARSAAPDGHWHAAGRGALGCGVGAVGDRGDEPVLEAGVRIGSGHTLLFPGVTVRATNYFPRKKG